MGLKPQEFYEMTVGEFSRYCLHRDITLTTNWSHTRFLSTTAIRLVSTRKVKEEDVFRLWTDYLADDEPAKQVIKGGKDIEEFLKSQENNPLP